MCKNKQDLIFSRSEGLLTALTPASLQAAFLSDAPYTVGRCLPDTTVSASRVAFPPMTGIGTGMALQV